MPETITNYLKWYAENFLVLEGGGSDDGKIYEIYLPYNDKTGSKLSFYFQETSDRIIVSDLSFTLKEMVICGFNLTKSKIDIITRITNNHLILFEESTSEIFFECSKSNLGEFYLRFNSFIQSLIEIDSLRVVLDVANIQQMFLEEIKTTFKKENLSFTLKPKPVQGIISDHSFDISLEKDNLKPIYIKVCGKLKTETQKQIAYSKLDIDQKIANNINMNVFHYETIDDTKIMASLRNMGVSFFSKSLIYEDSFFKQHYLDYRV